MDYRRIFTPLDQPSGHWQGQSLLGDRAGIPRAPLAFRAHAFFDAQDPLRSAKAAPHPPIASFTCLHGIRDSVYATPVIGETP